MNFICREGRFVLFPFVLAGLVLAAVSGVLLQLSGWQIVWAGLLLWAAGILVSLLLYALVLLVVSLFLPTNRPPKRAPPLLPPRDDGDDGSALQAHADPHPSHRAVTSCRRTRRFCWSATTAPISIL